MLVILPYFLVFLGFGLAIWSKYLAAPIQHFSLNQLIEQAADHAFSIVAGIFKEAANQDYEVYHMKYDVFWNMELPAILLIIATFCLGMACKLIYNQIQENHHDKFDYFLKWALIIVNVLISGFFVFNGGKLILLALLVIIVMVFILMIIPYAILSLFRSERTQN